MSIAALIHLANHGTYDYDDAVIALSEEDKATLHRWLSEFPSPRPRTLKQIAAAVGTLKGSGEVDATARGSKIYLNLDYRFTADTNMQVFAYLMAAVLSKGHAFAECIRRCPECGTYFFDKPSGRPIKQFCKPEHSNAFRQRKYRRRKSQ